jgi:hypothetical protein
MAINPNTDFSSGAILTAAQQNRFPRGIMGVSLRTTNFAPTSTASDFGSITFTAVADRYYKYSLFVPGADADASRLLTVNLVNASNVSVNTYTQTLRGPGVLDLVAFTTVRTETAGSLTRKIRMSTSAGNASMCSSTSIGVFVVEDLGPA